MLIVDREVDLHLRQVIGCQVCLFISFVLFVLGDKCEMRGVASGSFDPAPEYQVLLLEEIIPIEDVFVRALIAGLLVLQIHLDLRVFGSPLCTFAVFLIVFVIVRRALKLSSFGTLLKDT